MLPYLVAFFITNIVAYFGEKRLKSNKRSGIFLLIISLLPILLLCGLRTTEMGWDVKKYLITIFSQVNNLNLSGLKLYIIKRGTEKGFVFLVYILARLYNNINFVMFWLGAIVSFSVLYFAIKHKEKNSIVLTLLLYETVLYSITFSTLRQCVSLAIIIIACVKAENKKIIQTLALVAISFFFHNSAIFALVLLYIIFINDSKKIPQKHKTLLNVITLIILVFGLLFYENVMKFLWEQGILVDKYLSYLDSKYNSEIIVVRWPIVFLKVFNLMLGFFYFKNKKISMEDKKDNKKWFFMLIIDFVVTLLSFKIVNVHRVTYYIFFPAVFAFIPQTINIFENSNKNRMLAYAMISTVYLLYFISTLGYYSIYPYRSIIG